MCWTGLQRQLGVTGKGTNISAGLRPALGMVSNSPLGLLCLTGFHTFPARSTDWQEIMGVKFFPCSAAGLELRRSRSLGICLLRWRHLILIVNDFHDWYKPLIELSTGGWIQSAHCNLLLSQTLIFLLCWKYFTCVQCWNFIRFDCFLAFSSNGSDYMLA